MDSALVAIVIKCPAAINDATVDYHLQLPATKTIGQLRDELHSGHPCHPTPIDQRLIFRGHLLSDDTTTLGELCQSSASKALAIHMVLRSGNYGGVAKLIPEGPGKGCSFGTKTETFANLPKVEYEDKENINAGNTSNIGHTFNIDNHAITKNHADALDKGKEAMPRIPQVAERPSYYQVINDKGQAVYADIANALIFDGRQFYVMQGANPTLHQAAYYREASSYLPLIMHATQTTHRHHHRHNYNASVSGGRNTIETAQIRERNVQGQANNGERVRIVRRLIHINVAAVLSFLLRFVFVILIFYQGRNKVRLGFLCLLFGFIFLYQAGFFEFFGLNSLVRRLWEPIIQVRQRAAAAAAMRVTENQEENAPEPRPVDNQPLLPRIGEQQPGILYKFLEVITTFWLSIFPLPPPIIPVEHRPPAAIPADLPAANQNHIAALEPVRNGATPRPTDDNGNNDGPQENNMILAQ